MKLKKCMFAWNSNSNEVEVGPWPDISGWSLKYTMTAGATWVHVRDLTHDQCIRYLYVEAMHLIVRDKVDPMAVHNAFYIIDEYRDGLAVDMPKPLAY